jgi:hypothetical protein
MGEESGDAPRVYTADEAAAILKCKASWLKEQARQRKIPFTLIAGSYRWTAGHLDEILALREHRPQAPARPSGLAPRKAPRSPEPPAEAPQVPLLQSRPPRRRRRPPDPDP